MKQIALILASTVVGLGAANAAADGAKLYTTKCLACHQATGAGLPGMFPPLAESEWVNGPAENLIRIQLRGLTGPLTVKGKEYGSIPMAANASMTDEEIAAVLTHIRGNFGNDSSAVTADQVKALRSEVGKPPLKAEDLIDPNKAAEPEAKPAEVKPAEAKPAAGNVKVEVKETPEVAAAALKAGTVTAQGDVTKSEAKAGANKLVLGGVALWSIICILPVVTGFGRKA